MAYVYKIDNLTNKVFKQFTVMNEILGVLSKNIVKALHCLSSSVKIFLKQLFHATEILCIGLLVSVKFQTSQPHSKDDKEYDLTIGIMQLSRSSNCA